MGYGSFDSGAYNATRATRAATGTSAFTHTAAVFSGVSPKEAHETLSPLDAKGALVTREARDSDDHPTSTPIAILFDQTGSMGAAPKRLVDKLSEFYGLVTRGAYVADPQICFGAIGDGQTGWEVAPLQVGQFESDNRMADQLGLILLEGGGGNNGGESYGLTAYFFANQVHTDAYDKRGEKGFLFIVGDEPYLENITAAEASRYLGLSVEGNISVDAQWEKAKEKWHIFFIHVQEGSYQGDTRVSTQWRNILGEGYIPGTSVESVCETIALTIGMRAGAIDLDEGLDHLDEVGSAGLRNTVSKSLAHVGTSNSGAVAKSEAPGGLAATAEGGATRI